MILSNEFLYESILERMPYFSLKRLYYDISNWNQDMDQYDDQYSEIYSMLIEGEFQYEPEGNNIYSTVQISDMYTKEDSLYITNMDESNDFVDYCRLINAHPVEHPIYTRTLILDENNKFNGYYQLKYCRPESIKGWNLIKAYDENDIERIKEIEPDFDLRYIYDLIMRFGFYYPSSNTCTVLRTTMEIEHNDVKIIDEITNIYAFGPNTDNIGKSIEFN